MSDSAQVPTEQLRDGVGVTRSEEELRITTRRRATQRARLTKFLETEMVTRTIPLRREQARIEYEPISSDREEQSQPEQASGVRDEAWLVLYEEELVIQTRWVARERVRLLTRTVTEVQEITEKVRQERVEFGGERRPR